jgi:hypothetical protein
MQIMSIPTQFTHQGVLKSGTYDATFAEIRSSILVTGTGSSTWDSAWRGKLLDNAEILTKELWAIGIKSVFFDGSFVEDKDRPNDIDGYFDTELKATNLDLPKFAAMIQNLNLANHHKIWTWDPSKRITVTGFAKKQLPMWVRHRVELYPHLGQMSGIKDSYGNDLTFPSAFRQCRSSGLAKGIVKVIPGGQS